MGFDILCHCHLHWDFVWQRPQHLMTRMARRHRVFFLEDALPLPDGGETPRVDVQETPEGVTVLRPFLLPRTGSPAQIEEIDRRNEASFLTMLHDALRRLNVSCPLHWFYTPMAFWLAEKIPHCGIVYDCMDELSMFKDPPPGILEKERALLDCAGIVFTGGRSLYLGKSAHHPNVYMFASGVEVEHFGQACDEGTVVPEDMAKIPEPRLTYTGVIDERLDLGLMEALARKKPEWQIVMIGPVVKIEESDLPRRPNIHYLGKKPYAQLPGYLKGSQVAIMPFALNDATKFISPTKTLEYMAARRPVVSTPIADVVAYYKNIVWVASNPEEFVQNCEAALHADPGRLDEGVVMARSQTWDSIAQKMEELLEEYLKGRTECESGAD